MRAYILRKAFNIKTDELKKANYLIAMFLAVGFYFTLLGSISISVFDIRFGAQYLPYILFLFPVINIVFSYVYMKFLPIISKRMLFRYFIIIVFVIHLFNFMILEGVISPRLFLAVFLLLSMLVCEKLYFTSMILIQDVVDIESIKRILPMSTTVFTIASVTAAFLLRQLSGIIPLETLFMISGVFVIFIAYFADTILKKYRILPEEADTSGDEGFRGTLKYIRENSFFLILFLIAAVVDVTFNINDYLYNVIASTLNPQEENLVGFIGTTETFRYILTLVVDLFLFTRLVMKFGSMNLMKLVLLNIVLGATLISFGSGNPYALMISKIIFTVLVMLLSYSLLQLLYQPVHPKYKEKVMVIADMVVVLVGSLLGGVITLMHSKGIISLTFINTLTIVVSLAMLVLWQIKQPGFISIIEKTMNLSENLDIGKLFGKSGISGFLPYMTEKVKSGKPFEKLLMLDILKNADFKDKEKAFKSVVSQGNLEMRMKIIDMAFEGQLPLGVLADCGKTLDMPSIQYLLERIFMNYKKVLENKALEVFSDIKKAVDKVKLNNLQKNMYEYLFEDEKAAYERIVQQLCSSGKSSDLKVLIRIMSNFVGIEDDVNRSALISIMLNLKGYQGVTIETAELCSVYDKDMEMIYLKEVFTGNCQYDVVDRICSCYGEDTVIENLANNPLLIPEVYTLHAAARKMENPMDEYSDVYREVKGKLQRLTEEKLRISKSNHPVKVILIEELDKLISSVTVSLLEFLFKCYGVSKVNNLEKHLRSEDDKKKVVEIVKNSLPLRVSNEILPIMQEQVESRNENYSYSVLDIGGTHRILSNIYMILGGEIMQEQFGKEIEAIALLKNTHVFKDLDIESLFELLKTGEIIAYQKDQTVAVKGELSDKLFVIIEGKVGVYSESNGYPVSVLECGEVFGLEDVFNKGQRKTTIKAFDEALLFIMNGEELLSLINTNDKLAFSVVNVLAGQLRRLMTVA